MQPGSGSTDLFLAANWTYTGLFNLKRLVADEDFHALLRTQGTQATRLGSDIESRFWLSYRPYESKNVAREWFIGPVLTWLHSQDDRIAGVTQNGSGGDVLLAGVTTYVGVRPGMHLWLGMDWDVVHSTGRDVHACPPSHQFRNHAAVSDASLGERRNDEQEKTRTTTGAAWSCLLCRRLKRKSNISKCASKA